MSVTVLLYLLAFICFLLGGIGVNVPRLNWQNLGLAFLTLSLFVR